jgi:hypothetical protein
LVQAADVVCDSVLPPGKLAVNLPDQDPEQVGGVVTKA